MKDEMTDELRKRMRRKAGTITEHINELLGEMQCRINFCKECLQQGDLHYFEMPRLLLQLSMALFPLDERPSIFREEWKNAKWKRYRLAAENFVQTAEGEEDDAK